MITIVIPAYNEGCSIKSTIDMCFHTLRCNNILNGEVIIVDDGSNDHTNAIASNTEATVITHPHNIGYGRSLKDGITKAQYDTIVITDADGTYPINMIPDLLVEFNKGFDMVVGARRGTNYRESVFKMSLRLILKFLVEFTTGRKIDDINSGFRVFSKKTILPYFINLCDTFSFTTSLTLAYMMTGKFVKYIEIPYEKRIGKSKVKLFRDSLRTFQFIIEAILFYNPIKIYILFSFILVATGFSLLTIAYFTKLQVAFYSGIALTVLSFFMTGLGFLSVQLSKLIKMTYEK